MKEHQISREIQNHIKAFGGAVWSSEQGYRHAPGGTRCTPGIPDLIVIFPQGWTFAELKTPKGRLTESQKNFRDHCKETGIPWQLWRSSADFFEWATPILGLKWAHD